MPHQGNYRDAYLTELAQITSKNSIKPIDDLIGNSIKHRFSIPTIEEVGREFFRTYQPPEDFSQKINPPLLLESTTHHFVLTDDADHPLIITKEIQNLAISLCRDVEDDMDKSRALFNWVVENIKYGKEHRIKGYNTSVDVFKTREGVCGEMAVFFVALSRSVGLNTHYVLVERDCYNESVNHACAGLNQSILIDPAYKKFDVKHTDYRFLSDSEILPHFKNMRNNPKN